MGEGFLTYDELSVIEPDALMSMGELTEEQVQHIVDQAEQKAEAAEAAAAVERRRQREQERIDAATAEADQKEAALQKLKGEIPTGEATMPVEHEKSTNGAAANTETDAATAAGGSAAGETA